MAAASMEQGDDLALAAQGFTEAIAAASAELDAKRKGLKLAAAEEALYKSNANARAGLRVVQSGITKVKVLFSSKEFAENLQSLIKDCAGSTDAGGCFAGCVASKACREAQLRTIEGEWHTLSAKITGGMAEVQSAFERVGKNFEDVARSAQPAFSMLQDLPEKLQSKAEEVKSPDDVLNFDLRAFRSAADVSAVTGDVASLTTAAEEARAIVLKSKVLCSETNLWLVKSKKAIKKVATPSFLEGCLVGMAGGAGAVKAGKAAMQKLDGMMEALSQMEKSLGSPSLGSLGTPMQDATVPLKEFSAFATTKLDAIGDVQEGAKATIKAAKQARKKMNNVAADLKKGNITGAAKVAKGMVKDTLHSLTADGKEARGCPRESTYQFGDVTRGLAKKVARVSMNK